MPITNQTNNDATDPREAAAAKSTATGAQTASNMRTAANPWSSAVLNSRAAATGATDSPSAGGGIDPNTGEWSAHPDAPHVAGQTDGSGGYYGINYTPPSSGENSSTPYGTAENKPIRDPIYGNLPHIGTDPWAYANMANMYGRQANAAEGRAGPTINTAQSDADRALAMQSRGGQNDAIALQRQAALGQTPSVAQIQQQNGMNAAIQAQMAMANSARGQGANIAAAQRSAADNTAGLQANAINSNSLLRAQEMENARAGYLGATTQQRAQDLTQQGMSADQAYRQAQLEEQQRQLNDQAAMGYTKFAQDTLNSQLQADELAFRAHAGFMDAENQQTRDWQNKGLDAGINAMSSGASAAMMSDIRAKTNVQPAGASTVAQGANVSGPRLGMSSASPYSPSMGSQNMVSEGTKTMPYLGAGAATQSAFGGSNPGGQISVSEGTKVNSMPGNAFANAMTPSSNPGAPVQSMPAPYLGQNSFQYSPSMSTAPTAPMFGSMMSDENVKTDVRYADQGTYGKAKHNDYYREGNRVKSNAHWISNDPAVRQAYADRDATFGYVTSDARVKADVHAAGHAKGFEAGYKAAMGQENGMAMLGAGNGTAAQRNQAINAELARLGSAPTPTNVPLGSAREIARMSSAPDFAGPNPLPMASMSPAEWARRQDIANGRSAPPLTASPDSWEHLNNLRSGNIRQSDINDELESLDGQLPRNLGAPSAPAAQPMAPIESLHQAPYADYYEPADRGMAPMYKARNEDLGPLATNVMSDANVKTVDPTPVYKERYPDQVAKMKNENTNHAPEKDPKKFPMIPRPLDQVMSDENAKKVRPGGETEADAFLNSLNPISFKYKDPSYEPTDTPTGGRYLGVTAQSVASGPTGDTIVKSTPRGLALEGGALMSALASGTGRLNERVSALESQIAKSKKSK